jgi:hypothetical protein
MSSKAFAVMLTAPARICPVVESLLNSVIGPLVAVPMMTTALLAGVPVVGGATSPDQLVVVVQSPPDVFTHEYVVVGMALRPPFDTASGHPDATNVPVFRDDSQNQT